MAGQAAEEALGEFDRRRPRLEAISATGLSVGPCQERPICTRLR